MKKTLITISALSVALFGVTLVSPAAPAPKVFLCHVTAGNGTGHVIEVNGNAVAGHLGHGDGPAAEGAAKGSACTVGGGGEG